LASVWTSWAFSFPPGRLVCRRSAALDGRLGQLVGAPDAAVAEPGGQAPDAEAAEGAWLLIPGQQGERAGIGEVQGPLQPRENAGELGPEPVDGAGAVGDQVHPAAREDLEVDDDVVAGA
jgi:hypothetical protein